MLVYFFSYVISLNTFCWLGKACFYSEKICCMESKTKASPSNDISSFSKNAYRIPEPTTWM